MLALDLGLRFKRKAGELIKAAPKRGPRGKQVQRSKAGIVEPPSFKDQGIDHHDAHLYQKLAAVPEGHR
jgi:hypothetical protein